MQQPPFISYGQNREDVVLWRALGSIPNGRYVEVGANDPVQLSVTKAFYDRGWSGLTVEPDPDFAQRLREARPRDEVVEAAVSAHEGDVTFFVFPGTGLSTLDPTVRQKHAAAGRDSREVTVRGARLADLVAESGIAKGDVHFLLVDVEGAEAEVLSTVDFTEWRPWVLLVESTAPLSTESTHGEWEATILDSGYQLCLFDGVSRFYVANERAEALRGYLSYPACAHDDFEDHHVTLLREQNSTLEQEVGATKELWRNDSLRWRRIALGAWADRAGEATGIHHSALEMEQVRRALSEAQRDAAAVRETLSWRVTRPLRAVRNLRGRL